MRRRTREAMSMAEDEMLALRFLLRRADRTARPAELAHYLGITTADTNALADKLQRDGRVERAAGFAIDRSASIRATESADAEVRDTLNGMHLLASSQKHAENARRNKVLIHLFCGRSHAFQTTWSKTIIFERLRKPTRQRCARPTTPRRSAS